MDGAGGSHDGTSAGTAVMVGGMVVNYCKSDR